MGFHIPKIWSVSLSHFIKHEPFIFEMWILYVHKFEIISRIRLFFCEKAWWWVVKCQCFFYLKKIRRLLWYESEFFQRLKINYLFSHPKIFLEFTNRQCSSTCRFTPLVLAKCSEIDRRTEYRLYAFGLRQENINIYVMWYIFRTNYTYNPMMCVYLNCHVIASVCSYFL